MRLTKGFPALSSANGIHRTDSQAIEQSKGNEGKVLRLQQNSIDANTTYQQFCMSVRGYDRTKLVYVRWIKMMERISQRSHRTYDLKVRARNG